MLKTAWALVLNALLCAGGLAAGADAKHAATPVTASNAVSSGEPQAQVRLVSEFSGFAGSDINARSLVAGLRQGSEITLTAPGAGEQPGTAARFTPPTRPMDYGNVRIALALAREQLAQLGITRPTPAQIRAVLAGGGIASHANGRTATPFLHPGLLEMRAGGMGWPKIAGTMGVTLAQVMNGEAPRQAGVPALPDSRRPAAASVTGGIVSMAVARPDVPAPRRSGAAPAREIRKSGASVVAAAAGAPRAGKISAPAREVAQSAAVGTTAARAPSDELAVSEEGQSAE